MELRDVRPGMLVRHYKGGYYRIIVVSEDSERRNRKLVIYCSPKTGEAWARPARPVDKLSPDDGAFCEMVSDQERFAAVPIQLTGPPDYLMG